MPQPQPFLHRFLQATTEKAVESAAWALFRSGLDYAVPGLGRLANYTYLAARITSSALGVKAGDGCHFRVGLVGIPGTFSCLVLRFREGGNDPGEWPQVSLGIDVNFLDPLKTGQAEFDGRAELPPHPLLKEAPPWPGEWTMEFGMEGIRNPAAPLRRHLWMPVRPWL